MNCYDCAKEGYTGSSAHIISSTVSDDWICLCREHYLKRKTEENWKLD